MRIDRHIIKEDATIKEALVKINDIGDPNLLTLFVVNDNNKLVGSVTDGDVRRGLIKGYSLDDKINKIYFKGVHYLIENGVHEYDKVKYLREKKLKLVPLVNKKGYIINLLDFSTLKALLPVDAVIMAGGKGTRLAPLTLSKPKPLLRVGNKEIISYNIDRLYQFGIRNQIITINYLGKQIREYCNNYYNKEIDFRIINEDSFLGTAGSLANIRSFKNETVLLMNSDLLTNINFEDFYKMFIDKKADLVVASIPYNVNFPYAILNESNQRITSFKEKPKFTYYANAGIYLMKKELINIIPKNTVYNATDLMNDAINKGLKVLHFPIRSYWLDIGKPIDFEQAQKDIAHIDFD